MFVTSSAADWQVIDGGQVGQYQGKTVTRYTGAGAVIP